MPWTGRTHGPSPLPHRMVLAQEMPVRMRGTISASTSRVARPAIFLVAARYSPFSVVTRASWSGSRPVRLAKPSRAWRRRAVGAEGGAHRRSHHLLLAVGLALGQTGEDQHQPARREAGLDLARRDAARHQLLEDARRQLLHPRLQHAGRDLLAPHF